ncbi:hypothetical protein EDF46_1337 [Frondihabitans sp. PhB188]|uniref:hypothetical protein n=1 Tax=Frondihabitans sp. PhB188 TaxID=2485200 RepID=UPI000F488280|nr:hypothetical protein [Frondihabitans sp. PhB188]ROQ39705.1 hypothetical protein EDF46_1337 [Frondihabitans sp. PhB188]
MKIAAFATVLLGLGPLSLLVPASAAQAAGGEVLSSVVEADLRAHMTEGAIAGPTQDRLIAKLERGEVLDVYTDASPIATTTRVGPDETVRETFADGSVKIVTLAGDRPSRTGLSGCGSSGGWKTSCKVSVWDPISSARFFVDYQTSGVGKAKVRSFHGATCAVVGGSCSLPSPTGIARATQSSAGPAWARVSYKANAGPIRVSGEFGLRVSGAKASTY